MFYRVLQRLFCVILWAGLLAAGFAAPGLVGRPREKTLVIVPARLRMVQRAFDLASLRPVAVLACRGDARAKEPLLFVWEKNAWQYVSPDDFRERRFLPEWPRRVIMIGDDRDLPPLLEEEVVWGSDVTRLKTLAPADLINGLDPFFRFTSREWKWLAKRYGLELTDINAPRRAFNPYAIPRSKLPLAKQGFKQQEGDTPPALLLESPDEAGEPPAASQRGEPALK